MPSLDLQMNGDGCWPDLAEGFIEGRLVGMARLKVGTVGGKPTVTVRVELPDGRTVLAETTLALFVAAARAFEVAP